MRRRVECTFNYTSVIYDSVTLRFPTKKRCSIYYSFSRAICLTLAEISARSLTSNAISCSYSSVKASNNQFTLHCFDFSILLDGTPVSISMGIGTTAKNTAPRRHSFDERILALNDTPFEVRTREIHPFDNYVRTTLFST